MVSELFVKVEYAVVTVVLPVKDTVLFVGSKLLSVEAACVDGQGIINGHL